MTVAVFYHASVGAFLRVKTVENMTIAIERQ